MQQQDVNVYPAYDANMPAEADEMEYALPEGFVYLDEAIEGVLWDAKYSTEDNFIGSVVDGYQSNRIACAKKMIPALIEARDLAQEKGYQLLIWDAARPQRAVDHFVSWAAEPEDGKSKEQHYPNIKKAQLFQKGYVAKRSGHSRGAAVDLTLVDAETGEAIDMGGAFDLMDKRSHHGAKGLTKQQTANRNALKSIMKQSGFSPYSNEWWHYTLNNEPFPGQYFDFVIGGRSQEEQVQQDIVRHNMETDLPQ